MFNMLARNQLPTHDSFRQSACRSASHGLIHVSLVSIRSGCPCKGGVRGQGGRRIGIVSGALVLTGSPHLGSWPHPGHHPGRSSCRPEVACAVAVPPLLPPTPQLPCPLPRDGLGNMPINGVAERGLLAKGRVGAATAHHRQCCGLCRQQPPHGAGHAATARGQAPWRGTGCGNSSGQGSWPRCPYRHRGGRPPGV
ncbi:unnamed protein product [Prorocentrum cordatum]|uniref:Uncharacterized protein n=1 Tax=Prorocentrum cordatum TaxID=2364126 RepID=A0ABN9V6S4_9DINO|nr:unnamed protein product [Polarella glacialis]